MFFSWLASSESERQRALDFVSLFDEPSTVDELGLGVIRDAIADQLTPGTSTIQTRARYFLLVPWVYRQLERKEIGSAEVVAMARKLEVDTILALAQTQEDGVIGRRSGATLKRLPSAVYWNGLGIWGIRRFPGSQAQYHRGLDGYYDALRAPRGESIEGPAVSVPSNWDPALPAPPDGFPKKLDTLSLRREEAEYLRDRITSSNPGTMLAFLVDRGRRGDNVPFPWMHPQFGDFPATVRRLLHHARCFSEAMHGAALLYNLLLSEVQINESARDENTANYREWLGDWAAELEDRMPTLRDWIRDEFWRLVRAQRSTVGPQTQRFVDAWLRLVIDEGGPASVADHEAARRLVRDRERQLKREYARLGNARALELWRGASGVGQLEYRWRITQTIVNDILDGLEA